MTTSPPIAEAATAVAEGGLVALPTDTVYGIGCRPDDPAATDRLFEAKLRTHERQLPVLVPSVVAARGAAVLDTRAEVLMAACWPGALTIVLPRAPAAKAWDLGGDPSTIGLRIPRHPLAARLLQVSGALAVTSANRSGRPPIGSCERLRAEFGAAVKVYLCDDAAITGVASTVVDLSHDGWSLLREGAITEDAIARLLRQGAPLLDSPLSP